MPKNDNYVLELTSREHAMVMAAVRVAENFPDPVCYDIAVESYIVDEGYDLPTNQEWDELAEKINFAPAKEDQPDGPHE